MCGIVGAASVRNIVPLLIDGVRRLEYRGYDSTGLAIIESGDGEPRLSRLVSTARVADLAAQAAAAHMVGGTGISHTRWATHGAPTPVNAHPLLARAICSEIGGRRQPRVAVQPEGQLLSVRSDPRQLCRAVPPGSVRDVFPQVRSQLPQGLEGAILYVSSEFVNTAIEEVELTAQRWQELRSKEDGGITEYAALRTLDTLYVEYVTGEREIYDLVKDPHQLGSLHATAEPEALDKLSQRLAVLRSCKGDSCRS
jgi:hypothetical protein